MPCSETPCRLPGQIRDSRTTQTVHAAPGAASAGHLRPELLHAVDEAAVARRVFLRFLGVGEGGFELLEDFTLAFVQAHRRFHHDRAEQVAGLAASHRFHALPAQAEFLASLGLGRNGDAGGATQDRYFDGRAQRRLRKTDRYFAVQVVAFAFEDRMRAHMDFDVQVARRRTRGTRFALPGQTDAIALVHPRRHLHVETAFVFQPAFSVTMPARGFDHAAGATAMRASLLDRENAVLHPHAAMAAASGTRRQLAVFGTRAVAVVAVDQGRYLDLPVDAGHGFLEVEFQHVAQIRTARRAPAAAENVGEDIAEDVADVAEWRAAAAPGTVLKRGVAILVIHRATLRVTQDFPGFLGFLEALLRLGIAGATIRMVLHRQPAKSLFQFLVIRAARDAEDFVVATFH